MMLGRRQSATALAFALTAATGLLTPLSANASSPAAAGLMAARQAPLALSAGVAIAPDDVWLVGGTSQLAHVASQTIARHWDGATWSGVPTPNPGDEGNFLTDVDASSSTDVWAVGEYGVGQDWHSLAEHWDGASWTVVPLPDEGGHDQLLDVSVVTSHDVWASGWTLTPLHGFLLHWDGHAWSTVGSRVGQYLDLSAESDTDVWTTYDAHPSRWDGARWNDKFLWVAAVTIAAIGPDDVWAAGGTGWRHSSISAFAHFDGTTWAQTVIDAPGHGNVIRDLSAVASNDVWAVGQGTKNGSQIGQVLHWDGTSWTTVLNRTAYGGYLAGVVATGPDDAWAFGLPHGSDSPLNAMHWNGSHWKPFAVP